ncbi:hypothetical protein [Chitinophaga defluvii]|uniref:Uncharacterized protein n=1 Tax=Chitinophaga defluvii TaxID=3163343 RepID=A0ABV2T3X8_9BACT
MAKLSGGLQFTGSISGMSAYRMKGSDEIIFRTKGGGSKSMIKRSPSCLLTRQNGTEFSGCGKAAGSIRMAIQPVLRLSDYNFTGTLTALSKSIQLFDKKHLRGQRAICFSEHRYLLEGFQLNKTHQFDSIIRHPLQCEVMRNSRKAVVQLPDLLPRLNLFIPWQYPLYRFVFSLGVVKDTIYSKAGYPTHSNPDGYWPVSVETNWHPVQEVLTGKTYTLQLAEKKALEDNQSLVLAVGIQMGIPTSNNFTAPVAKKGSARIIMVR